MGLWRSWAISVNGKDFTISGYSRRRALINFLWAYPQYNRENILIVGQQND